jgi:hypothetical protein
MKEVALLELRDSLLIRCLRGPINRQGAMVLMQGFSFEWVAEKAAFRECNGLCHLLHILHAFPDERDLQIGVGCVLRNVSAPHPSTPTLASRQRTDVCVYSRCVWPWSALHPLRLSNSPTDARVCVCVCLCV